LAKLEELLFKQKNLYSSIQKLNKELIKVNEELILISKEHTRGIEIERIN